MTRLAPRVAKLEAVLAARKLACRVERHIIHGDDEAEREAKIAAIVATSPANVFHIFRTITAQSETTGRRR